MSPWHRVCRFDELLPDRGVAALVGGRQLALFRLTDSSEVHTIDHHDPVSRANVMARGLVGSRDGVPTVASPMHKQTFDLRTGACLDEPGVAVRVWPTRIAGHWVEVCLGGGTT